MAPRAQADVLLKVASDVEGIRTAQTEFIKMKSSMSELAKAGAGLGLGFNLATTAINAVKSAFGELKGMITEGVKFNATLEQSQIGVASILRQFNPTQYRSFQSAIQASTEVIDELKKKALETPATFQELLEGYQGTAGAMFAANIPLKKQVDLITNMSQALTALGINQQELRQETTAILMGNIDKNARAAKTLGITAEDIAAAKEQGSLYEFLTLKIAAFSEGARYASQSVSVLESNLGDAKTQMAAEATKELTASYKELLIAVTELVKSDAFKQLIQGFASVAKSVIDSTKGFIKGATSMFSDSPRAAGLRALDQGDKLKDRLTQASSQQELDALAADTKKALAAFIADADNRVGSRIEDPTLKSGKQKQAEMDAFRLPYTEADIKKITGKFEGILQIIKDQGSAIAANNAELKKSGDLESRAATISRNIDADLKKRREDLVKDLPELEKKAAEASFTSLDPTARLNALNTKLGKLENQLVTMPKAAEFIGPGEDAKNTGVQLAAEQAATAKSLQINEDIAKTKAEIRKTQTEIVRQTNEQYEWEKKLDAEFSRQSLDDQEGVVRDNISKLENKRAALEADYTKTENEKRQKGIDLLKQERAELTQFIAVLGKQMEGASPDEQTNIKGRRDKYLSQRDGIDKTLTTEQAQPDVNSIGQNLVANFTTFRNQLGTIAQDMARMISDPFKTGFDSINSEVTKSIIKAQGWHDAWVNIQNAVAESFVASGVRMTTDYIANLLLSQARELGLTSWLEGEKTAITATGATARAGVRVGEAAHDATMTGVQVATHTTGEVAKTGATFGGSLARGAIRLGETIFHGIQVAIRVAAHLAGEVLQTGITIIQAGLRIASMIAESIVSVVKAAVGALSAMASIPYVGPFLAAGAFAAMLGLGMGLVSSASKGFKDGGYTGDGNTNEVAGPAHRGEYYFNAGDVKRIGRANIEAFRYGRTAVGGGMVQNVVAASPVQNDGGKNVQFVFTTSELEATRIKKNSAADTHIIQTINGRSGEIRI